MIRTPSLPHRKHASRFNQNLAWTAKDAGTNGVPLVRSEPPDISRSDERKAGGSRRSWAVLYLAFGEVWLPFAVSAPPAGRYLG